MKVVSACLAGVNCKYNGGHCLVKEIKELVDNHEAITICPEVLGGLSIPRDPAERIGDKVITSTGLDVTEAYHLGAIKVLDICEQVQATEVILKSKSPTCGVHEIYDGNFNHTVIQGHGVTAELLLSHGYKVITEEEYKKEMLENTSCEL
ncbi:DUF523 domain-containing protein [Anaerorhabdus sp.]|uniref:DUF523 domain-containing protein n=1 Tax=Anaerorhabdus sp. TaxID=1872524 RepID=UPI002FC92991